MMIHRTKPFDDVAQSDDVVSVVLHWDKELWDIEPLVFCEYREFVLSDWSLQRRSALDGVWKQV